MKARVYRTWEWDKATEMEFNTLEELLEFTKREQAKKDSVEGTILSWNKDEKIWEIEIYDGYRE